jgi:hypothetical protein
MNHRSLKSIEADHRMNDVKMLHNKALQRTRLSDGCFSRRSVRAAELGR